MHHALASRIWVLLLRAVVFVLGTIGVGLMIVPFVGG